jgi:MobA/MobL family
MRVMELHSPVKIVQRSKGRTATAAAAYRSGTRIECERTGEVYDYTRKKGIELTSLLFPAEAPDWAHDRAALWNAAEKREKHPRAQTAREVEIAFPAEFSAEQRREAGLSIGSLIVERYGVAADLCWHKPSRKGDERKHHLHILFTTRRFENGDWAKNKDRTLDDLYGKGAEEIASLRQGLAGVLNNIAARDRLPVYVEHLSFEKRGLDQEATQHMGPIATEMERRGRKTDIGDRNREVQTRNNERRQLHQERKVINLEIERERLRLKHPRQSPAPPSLPPDPYKAFYQETQSRRLELLGKLDRQYGPQEKEARQELAQLYSSVSNLNLIVRFWRNIIGRTQKEKDRIARVSASLENIQKRKQEVFDAFERDRQERLEALKKAERQGPQEQDPEKDFDKFSKANLIYERAKARRKNAPRQQGIDYERD